MLKGDPYWLSTDIRVFKLFRNGNTPGSNTIMPDPGPNPSDAAIATAALSYINALLQEFRGRTDFNNDLTHPFEQLTQDEQQSWLEQSQMIMGAPVFNFAVAKVRYRAKITAATGVQVFFRTFMTMRSALDYVYVGASPPSINYARSGAWPNGVPLLGSIDGDIASIPYFAVPRIDSVNQSMTGQPIDTPNVQTINAVAGQENVMFFGVWLDFNQPTNRFPFNPVGNGGFGGAAQPIRRSSVGCISVWSPKSSSSPAQARIRFRQGPTRRRRTGCPSAICRSTTPATPDGRRHTRSRTASCSSPLRLFQAQRLRFRRRQRKSRHRPLLSKGTRSTNC